MRINVTLPVYLVTREEGATAVEYAIMVALITLAIVAAVTALGLSLPGLFQPAIDTLS